MKTPANLAEMAHEETGQWLDSDLLETWVVRRFNRLEQKIRNLESELEAKVRQNAQLMRERDAYRAAEEAQIALRQKMKEERDALAALFVRLQDGATDLIHASSEEEAGDAMELIAECSEKEARSILARVIAESRIEGALAVRHLTQGDDWEDTELRAVIDDYVAGLRRQAEAPQ